MGEKRGNKLKNPNVFQTDYEKLIFLKVAKETHYTFFSPIDNGLGLLLTSGTTY